MRLGDLLIAAKLVTAKQVEAALARQVSRGGRLGDNLVAVGAIDQNSIDAFLAHLPREPTTIAETGIAEADLRNLLLKLIYVGHLETVRQFVDAIKLPQQLVAELVRGAVERSLLRAAGSEGQALDMRYGMTEGGQRAAVDALGLSQYAGPAPVSLEDFAHRVQLQKITNELVTWERIRDAFSGLTIGERFIEQVGPAVNSGLAILLYGPPGNGKTSIALRLGSIFDDVIYVPHAISVEGQVIHVYDPSLHMLPAKPSAGEGAPSAVRREAFDARWVPCKRPFVVTGGELTLEMLDLAFSAKANFYEAPLHVKALGGCFIIDDFGRQLVAPADLLNRWIGPLERRVEYLKLHTGKSFGFPFEELVIFSTNMEPEDLMDQAFLRRIPYKLAVMGPTLEPRFIDYAIDNLRVTSSGDQPMIPTPERFGPGQGRRR